VTSDDELAALLGLDALASGQTRQPPPTGLRDLTIAAATRVRTPDRPVDAALPCPPVEAFARTVADFRALLASLPTDAWDRPAHAEHGRVRDLVAHLVGVERLSLRWLDPDDDVPPLPDHVAATRDTVSELADADPATLAATWRDTALAVVAAAAVADPQAPVAFHDFLTSPEGFLVIRTFEVWAHSLDVAAAADRPSPTLDPARMALMSSRLMAAVPLALAVRGTTAPSRTARFVLTGSAGGCYSVPLHPGDVVDPAAGADLLVVADTVDVCRLAARRLDPAELDAVVEGDRDLARAVLAGLAAFARD
jgi:uncharacterized protein (TIGR03083 family)